MPAPTSFSLPPLARHLSFLLPVLGLVALAVGLTWSTLPIAVPVRVLCVALLSINLLVLAMSSWTSVLGALVSVLPNKGSGMAAPKASGRSRTAVVMPIHEEDPARVFAAMSAMRDALAGTRTGAIGFFVLSDTPDGPMARAEEQALAALDPDALPALHYRRRALRGGKKAGNLADFITRHGGSWDYMVVLDADSVMTGTAIERLIGLMDANPRAGLVQSMCYPVGRDTPFARVQQFGAHLQGRFLARGSAFWQGPRGGYWGHNAIMRIDRFAASCALPHLPGTGAFGGEILCHDTVEAALMVRAGHEAWIDAEAEGSWEEIPTNAADDLVRERRWCQGNMQHLGVVGAHGLHPVSRIAIGGGILHYLNGPAFLLGLAVSAVGVRVAPAPAQASGWGLTLLVMCMLFLPRMLSAVRVMLDPDLSWGFGGRPRILLGLLQAQILSFLTAPVAMAFQTQFVLAAFTGRTVGWSAQARGERGPGWSEMARALLPVTLTAVAIVALLTVATGTWVGFYLLPGLLGAVPVAVLCGRLPSATPLLFDVPDDTAPAPIRRAVQALEARLRTPGIIRPGAVPSLPPENGLAMPIQELGRTQPGPAPTPVAQGRAFAEAA